MRYTGIDLVDFAEVTYKNGTMDGFALTRELKDPDIEWKGEWTTYAQDILTFIDKSGDIADEWDYATIYMPDIEYRGLGVHFKKVIIYPDGFTEMEIIK